MTRKIEILPFMTSELGLSGNELVLFAIMWRDSEKGVKDVECDYTTMSGEMNVSFPTMYNCLKKLADRGYIMQKTKSIYCFSQNFKNC